MRWKQELCHEPEIENCLEFQSWFKRLLKNSSFLYKFHKTIVNVLQRRKLNQVYSFRPVYRSAESRIGL